MLVGTGRASTMTAFETATSETVLSDLQLEKTSKDIQSLLALYRVIAGGYGFSTAVMLHSEYH